MTRDALRAGVVALIVAAGCGSSTPDHGSPLGTVVSVLSAEAYLNGEPTSAGDEFGNAAVLSTDGSGALDFEVQGMSCLLLVNSRVEVGGGTGPLLRYQQGKLWCERAGEGGSVTVATEDGDIQVAEAKFGLAPGAQGRPLVRVTANQVQTEFGPVPAGFQLDLVARPPTPSSTDASEPATAPGPLPTPSPIPPLPPEDLAAQARLELHRAAAEDPSEATPSPGTATPTPSSSSSTGQATPPASEESEEEGPQPSPTATAEAPRSSRRGSSERPPNRRGSRARPA